MNAHTPGPWRVTRHTEFLVKVETRNTVICDALGKLTEETLANARLIASAPEMLAALEACLPWLGKAVFYDIASLPVQTSKEDLSSVLSMAGKAIAKARGES